MKDSAEAVFPEELRIGIDGLPLRRNMAGVGRYVYELCRELSMVLPNAKFFVYSNRAISMPRWSDQWNFRVDKGIVWERLKPIVWLKARCGVLCKNDALDVFWGGAHFLPSLPPAVPAILTIHDFVHEICPYTIPLSHLVAFKMFFHQDVSRARTVITNSVSTASRLKSYVGRIADRIVQPCVSSAWIPAPPVAIEACINKYQIPRMYILAVGTTEPRKNLGALLDAWVLLKRAGVMQEIALVIVGGRGWKDSALRRRISDARSLDVSLLGYVPDADLVALYSGTQLFVYPSIYEGFGMPVSEARACGARIVTTDCPELHEAGGADALYVAPTPEGIATGITRGLQLKNVPSALPRQLWGGGATIMAKALIECASRGGRYSH